MKSTCLLGLLALLVNPLVHAQRKPTVTPDDYGRWESLGPTTLSPDGNWFTYGIRRVNEEHELRIRPLNRDTLRIVSYGMNPSFSTSSRWLAYAIDMSPSEKERLEKEKEPVRRSVGILNLTSGEESSIPNIASFAFSEDGNYIALEGYAPKELEGASADLTVRDLRNGTTTHFGDVAEFAWAEVGALLAMIIKTQDSTGNGVQLFDPTTGSLRVLQSSKSVYRKLVWRDDDDDLALYRAVKHADYKEDTHAVLTWVDLRTSAQTFHAFDPLTAQRFPAEMRIAEHRTPEWSDDGTSVYFGVRPWTRVEQGNTAVDASEVSDSSTAKEEELSDVQIWHSKDERIIPMQRAQERRDLERTLLAVWHLESNRFVQLGSDLMESTQVLEGDRHATETSRIPYQFEGMFGRRYVDVHLIDVQTGERTKILEKVRHYYGGSSTGRYLLYFTGDDFWTYDVVTGENTNRTDGIAAVFANREYDYPVQQLPPYGQAGWTERDEAILVYDKYDVWRLPLSTDPAVRMTEGAAEQVVHRYVRLDPDEQAIDLQKPVYLRISGEWSKRSGYARMQPGQQPERLVFEDKFVSGLRRAEDADVFVYSVQGFDDSPDLFTAGPNLRGRRITGTNPFQGDYAWGRSELIGFESTMGKRLQAALYYPVNYDASKKYPMIVYNYEILSTRVHFYEVPSERDYYNFTVFTNQGYFVLLPDIVYSGRDPGRSAVAAVVPAVQAVVDRGLVDPARIGLVGHSWGGYQATYIPTQTDIFAASVAGAPLTNFLSFMGAIHWNPGLPETGHWETGQARMEVPFWEDFEAHVRNSPAAFVHRLETPMLMMFGDADGVVDWRQGVEFYNYARRAGSENFVLLVYPGEDHGLRKKQHQVDYHRRILEWFGHYLKGDPAPKWISEGVSHLDRKQQLEKAKKD